MDSDSSPFSTLLRWSLVAAPVVGMFSALAGSKW
jgi:hypothetical protein